MATYIQLSNVDFNDGFSPATIEFIKGSLSETKSLLLIASRVSDFEKTDNNSRALLMHFKNIGVTFDEYRILDRRMPDDDQHKAIEKASVVLLGGGDTLAQIDYIKAQGLLEQLHAHSFVVGLSAGAMNMAKRSIVLINPYRDRTWVYEGIGLVDSTIIPHFDRYDDEFIETEILPLTYDGVIYGLCNDAAIIVQDKAVRYAGTIYKMINGQKQLVRAADGGGTK